MSLTKKHNKPLAALVLLVSILAVYWQTLHHDFVNFDDPSYVYNNEIVKSGLNARSIRWAFSFTQDVEQTGNWHPLTWLSHMLDCQIYGLNPAGHHLTSVILHIINTLLILLLFCYATGQFRPSLAVAFLFALHPLRVEPVAWIAARKELLSTMFGMITIIAYVGFVKNSSLHRYTLALAAFALSLLAKPMLVTLPFVLLLFDYWPLKRFSALPVTRGRVRLLVRLFAEKLPFFGLAAVESIITLFAQRSAGAIAAQSNLPFISRASNALISYAKYIEMSFLPIRLEFFYPHPGPNVPLSHVAISVLVLCVISVVLVFFYRRQYTLMGWLWYLGTLVPVIGFVQVGSTARADRYTYVPGIGLAVIVVWALTDLTKKLRPRPRNIFLILSSAMVYCALAVLSYQQVKTWKNDLTLFNHAVKVDPQNWYAHELLANTFAAQGQYDEAIEQYRHAQKIRASARLENYIGVMLIKQKKFDQAVHLYQQFLPPIPDTNETPQFDLVKYGKLYATVMIYADAHVNCGFALWQMGQVNDALAHFYEALRVKPDYIPAHTNLVNLFLGSGDYDRAITQSHELLKLTPHSPQAYTNLALALFNKGRYDQAIANFQTAIKLDPSQTIISYHLAEALEAADLIDRAIEEYRKALAAYPDWLALKNKLAFLLAAYKESKYHNPKEAVKLATEVCQQLNYTQPEPMDTLAIAYAADGDFASAVKTAQQALKLAHDADNTALARDIKTRLNLYESRRAYYRPSSTSRN